MRELTLQTPVSGSDCYYTFYEDGTYLRSSDRETCLWKLDDERRLVYRDTGNQEWSLFFHGANSIDAEFSEKMSRWVDELEFYDAVDKVLE